MMRIAPASRRRRSSTAGLTLVELIVAFSILLILSTMALPMTKMKVQREKERRLRMALEEIRTAIDRYKDAADAGLLGEQDPDNHGYPESLDILVEGVEVNSGGAGMGGMPGMPGMGGQQGMGGMQQGGVGGRNSGFGNQGSAFGGNRNSGGFGSGGSSFGNRSGGNRKSGGFGSSRSGSSSGSRGGFGSSGLGESEEDEDKKMRFLRKIPEDPITGTAEWGMRSVSDSPDSMSWGGGNVFDVFSMSMETSLDGTRYSDW